MIELTVPKKKMMLLLLAGILGCLCMGGSDWLMIYGDTAFEGSLAWLTLGVAQIPAWRNGLAMLLAFPAVILYSLGLFGLRHFFRDDHTRKTYSFLTALGMTPWLCLHLFYVMILALFAWLMGQGETELAYAAGEMLFENLGWVVLIGQIIMILPFGYLFWIVFSGKSDYPGWSAVNNPLFLYLILKVLVGVLPDTPFRLAFINGLMSESMLIFFVIHLICVAKKADE